jgi:hypothetical protein
MKKTMFGIRRKAIAMVELIFAIVIMGIVLLSVPNLIAVATKSGYISLQQEAISVAASQISLLMTKHWDENNVIDAATGVDDTTILIATGGAASLATRVGARDRSFVSGSGVTFVATPIGAESSDFDDIDDANGTSMTLRNFSDTQVTAGDIIDTNISISTIVHYVNDAASTAYDYNTSRAIQYNFTDVDAGTITNIKSISINLTTSNPAQELSKNISLQAFTCNIGSYMPTRRQIP